MDRHFATRPFEAARNLPWCLWAVAAALAPITRTAAQQRPLLPIPFENSAEMAWLKKPVLAGRLLDDMTRAETWRFSGTGRLSFPSEPRLGNMRVMRMDLQLFHDTPAPTRNRLSSVTLRRNFDGEDWREYNRLSLWVKTEARGVPTAPLQIVLHNDGGEKVPDRYGREGIHYVTLTHGPWRQIVWEIDNLARDRVTAIEIGYWINKMYAGPGDTLAFEFGRLELQRVRPDHHTGWDVAPGELAYSHLYDSRASKSVIASDLSASEFSVVRLDNEALGGVVVRKPVSTVTSARGRFQVLDFSELRGPGRYVVIAGDRSTRPIRIANNAWRETIWETLNFFYGNRCGGDVPGSHPVDHLDWFATLGRDSITMSGGWHDAGDLSQGVINTGEATYALFALSERVRAIEGESDLYARIIEEARWGLDWTMRVRFPGGYRIAFASHNVWSNNRVGDADDRSREARNNPNANYISAAAEAIAYRALKDRDPTLATQALRLAEEDWSHATVGVEGPSTWHTPAFAATRMELAGIGVTASVELYRATGKRQYADKAVELARVIVQSQQRQPVGTTFPLAGFFHTGPDRDTIFHQFHRGNDQAPVVALLQLARALPDHPDRPSWETALDLHLGYLKQIASTTAPYGVLPAYVYRPGDAAKEVPDSGALHMATRDAYREQVRAGLPMGNDWYLRSFPVWFARRGNYGILLSQAKALATLARFRNDSVALDLAHRQAQWVSGLNPFAQSTIYGVGYGWSQQYSVSSGDFVGSVPVGIQSRGTSDLPYWPPNNMYVWKEVWVHSTSRWLWLMEDLLER